MIRVRRAMFVSVFALFALCKIGMPNAEERESVRNTIRQTLGGKIAASSPLNEADLNADDFVNVLDATLLRLRESGRRDNQAGHAVRVAGTEQVIVEPARVNVLAGDQVAVLILLRGNSTPLLGYTIHV